MFQQAFKNIDNDLRNEAVMPNLSNTDLENLIFDLPPVDLKKSLLHQAFSGQL